MTVIVIDDSPLVRQEVVAMLAEQTDISVIAQAGEISQGLRAIVDNKPDCVVLDIRMPGGSGFTLLNFIKKYELCRKVIILTNYSEACYRSQAQILGADYFFDKSSEFEKIVEAIRAEQPVRTC